ncbi:MAG: hypothetical protein WBI04_03875 [Trichlorobacter sp.]|jgi:hypothetical protein
MKLFTGLLCCLIACSPGRPVMAETRISAAAKKAPPPALSETKLSRLIVSVTAVDYKKRTITFKESGGRQAGSQQC